MKPHYFQEPVSGELLPQFLQYLPSLVTAAMDMKRLGGYHMLNKVPMLRLTRPGHMFLTKYHTYIFTTKDTHIP
jgi:hypothetical protein